VFGEHFDPVRSEEAAPEIRNTFGEKGYAERSRKSADFEKLAGIAYRDPASSDKNRMWLNGAV
jgi:hypothetical protein